MNSVLIDMVDISTTTTTAAVVVVVVADRHVANARRNRDTCFTHMRRCVRVTRAADVACCVAVAQ